MNKTKIEWTQNKEGKAGYTWNPVTGCFHSCSKTFCYANKIANRFGCKDISETIGGKFNRINTPYGEIIECIEKAENTSYPQKFAPTYHRYRINEPGKKTKSQNIFVCSMGELFGEWVPEEWIEKVFDACFDAPQHKYLFLTKNPKRYYESVPLWKRYHNKDLFNNIWLGASGSGTQTINEALNHLDNLPKEVNKYISIEPLFNEVQFAENITCVNWIIVGAQTGPGKKPPKKEWVQFIINQARAAGIPIFLKDNLNWPDKIQEIP